MFDLRTFKIKKNCIPKPFLDKLKSDKSLKYFVKTNLNLSLTVKLTKNRTN